MDTNVKVNPEVNPQPYITDQDAQSVVKRVNGKDQITGVAAVNQPAKNLIEDFAQSQREFTCVNKAKTATVTIKSGGQYKYKYADFGDVLRMAIPVLSRNGLAFSQPIRRGENGGLVLFSVLYHRSGESLQSDGIPIPNALTPQDFGRYLTYWRRYDGCSLLGIQLDEDDDGAIASSKETPSKKNHRPAAPAEPKSAETNSPANVPRLISDAQRKRLFAISRSKGLNDDEVKAWLKNGFKVESSREIAMEDYQTICETLQALPVKLPKDEGKPAEVHPAI